MRMVHFLWNPELDLGIGHIHHILLRAHVHTSTLNWDTPRSHRHRGHPRIYFTMKPRHLKYIYIPTEPPQKKRTT